MSEAAVQEAPVTTTETHQEAPPESAQDVDTGLLPNQETAGTTNETVAGESDTENDGDTGPSAEADPIGRQSWLQKLVDDGEATSELKRELGSLNQSIRAREANARQAEADRLKAAETKTSLRNKFIADVAGSDDNSREFIERQNLATTYIDEIMATADTHVNADRLVGFRSLLRETYKDSPAELATLDQLNGFDAHLSAVIRAAHDEGARTASEAGPMGAELKKLRETAKKFEEIGGDGHYKKVIGDKVSERAKGVAPSSAGKESGSGSGWSTKAEARSLHAQRKLSNDEMRRINSDPSIPEGYERIN